MSFVQVAGIVWIIFQVIIGIHLVLPLVLFVLHSIKGNRTASPTSPLRPADFDYAVIVTAYEQTDSLPAVVNSILKLNYTNYLVYVVADKCDITGLSFDPERVVLLRPPTVLAGNTRSHFYAINNFRRDHDLLTIIDSDNLVQADYLDELNIYFSLGFKAVQGIRAAKNIDTVYACLDAARDIYYHYYDGKILFNLGSSATLAGSGMAFTTQLYKDCLGDKDVNGAGFDKVLQAAILEKDLRIAFTGQAVVFDEKTSKPDQLVNQRSRWINTWFRFFGYGFKLAWLGIKNFSFNQFLFGIILLRPPLFIFIILSGICMLADLLISPLSSLIWLIAFGCFILGFALSLTHSKTDERIYKSLVNIPQFIFYQVLSLLRVRNANKRSVATRHHVNDTIENIKQNED
ncbi:glycosyltransferase [Hufsiella ginkgonis]|uniref:Glycosyltransferase n=1 Tax=Hufsiella ginkgonis TaxID=2695274 RepID=A0A7K1XZN0_9SPHI|nr:glycosyltransferase [Hufsiella ginkgonis]MXV16179.1 glycosyltransferase [Hufsiella ginkgonis]